MLLIILAAVWSAPIAMQNPTMGVPVNPAMQKPTMDVPQPMVAQTPPLNNAHRPMVAPGIQSMNLAPGHSNTKTCGDCSLCNCDGNIRKRCCIMCLCAASLALVPVCAGPREHLLRNCVNSICCFPLDDPDQYFRKGCVGKNCVVTPCFGNC